MAIQPIMDYSAVISKHSKPLQMAIAYNNHNLFRMSLRTTGFGYSGHKSLNQTLLYASSDPSCWTYLHNGGGIHNTDNTDTEGSGYSVGGVRPTQFVIMVETKKISDLTYAGWMHKVEVKDIDPTDSVSVHCPVNNVGMSWDDFKTTYADKFVITRVQFYDNTKDGDISPANQRTSIGKSGFTDPSCTDVMMRFYASRQNSIDGDYDILYPYFIPLLTTADNKGFNSSGGSLRTWIGQNIVGIDQWYVLPTQEPIGYDWTGSGHPTSAKQVILFDNLAQIKYLMNDLGYPWSFSQTEINSSNTAEFPDYEPSGQGTDTTGGGTGTGDNTSDDITDETPDVSVISTFNRHYAVSQAMLNVLTNYLWTSTFIDDIKLLFNNPMECVVSCRMFPFNIVAHDSAHTSGPVNILLGNVETTAPAYVIGSSYNCKFNLGEIAIDEYFGTAMDYEPYTTIAIYLPYIGIKDLSTNEITGKTLKVVYIVDITTGACIAQVWADAQLLYSYDGKIGVEIPINSSNAAQFAAGLLLTGMSAIGGFAASGGNPLAMAGTVLATAKSVASNQFHVNKGGSNSPFASFYMPQYCYLIINRPIQSLASNFGAVHGYPSNTAKILSTLKGYTECEAPILTSISATDAEKAEIIKLLETGVIIV